MSYQIQLRSDTAANWTSVNSTLAQGEIGLETDTNRIKIGNGSTAWVSLAYASWTTVSPAFTSNPTAPTQTRDDNSTKLATTAYADQAVATQAPLITMYNDTDPIAVYAGGHWSLQATFPYYGYTNHYSSTASDTCTISFYGTQISVNGCHNWAQGKMSCAVDGGGAVTEDNYAAVEDDQANLWTSPVLTCGFHVLVITVLGTKNAASANYYIQLGAFIVYGGGGINDRQLAFGSGTGVPDVTLARTAAGVATLTGVLANAASGGSNTAASAAVLTPTLGAAAQLSDRTRDYMAYIQVGTAGTALVVAIGPTSGVATVVHSSGVATAGQLVTVRLPAGWYIQVTATTATWATTAISC